MDLEGFACKMLTGAYGRAMADLARHSANNAPTHPQAQKTCRATTFQRIWRIWRDLKGYERIGKHLKCRGVACFLPLWVRGRVVCAMSRQVGHCAPVIILHANPHRSAQMLPNALVCSHMLSYAITCSQMRSHALRCFQMFPNIPRRLLMRSDAFRCPRILSDTFMYPQMPSDALRYSQML